MHPSLILSPQTRVPNRRRELQRLIQRERGDEQRGTIALALARYGGALVVIVELSRFVILPPKEAL
jgi:hypothetical protein